MSWLSDKLEGANAFISKIYGQTVRLGLAVYPAEKPPPPIIPEVTITPPKVYEYGKEKAIDYAPYLIIGGVVVVLILISRR